MPVSIAACTSPAATCAGGEVAPPGAAGGGAAPRRERRAVKITFWANGVFTGALRVPPCLDGLRCRSAAAAWRRRHLRRALCPLVYSRRSAPAVRPPAPRRRRPAQPPFPLGTRCSARGRAAAHGPTHPTCALTAVRSASPRPAPPLHPQWTRASRGPWPTPPTGPSWRPSCGASCRPSWTRATRPSRWARAARAPAARGCAPLVGLRRPRPHCLLRARARVRCSAR